MTNTLYPGVQLIRKPKCFVLNTQHWVIPALTFPWGLQGKEGLTLLGAAPELLSVDELQSSCNVQLLLCTSTSVPWFWHTIQLLVFMPAEVP